MKKLTFLVTALLILTACDQKGSTESTKERAKAEQEAGTDVNNNNLAKKAEKMEEDLRKRYRFFAAIDYNYEGRFMIGKNNYKLKITLVPTLRLVETGRVRTLEEIQDDFNNLMLIAKTAVWDADNNRGIDGCVFDKVSPGYVNGNIELASSICANSFSIKLTVPGTAKQDRALVARKLADALFDGTESVIEYLHVDVSSKYNPEGYSTLVKKTN